MNIDGLKDKQNKNKCQIRALRYKDIQIGAMKWYKYYKIFNEIYFDVSNEYRLG
jgi:hypothetical protein